MCFCSIYATKLGLDWFKGSDLHGSTLSGWASSPSLWGTFHFTGMKTTPAGFVLVFAFVTVPRDPKPEVKTIYEWF